MKIFYALIQDILTDTVKEVVDAEVEPPTAESNGNTNKSKKKKKKKFKNPKTIHNSDNDLKAKVSEVQILQIYTAEESQNSTTVSLIFAINPWKGSTTNRAHFILGELKSLRQNTSITDLKNKYSKFHEKERERLVRFEKKLRSRINENKVVSPSGLLKYLKNDHQLKIITDCKNFFPEKNVSCLVRPKTEVGVIDKRHSEQQLCDIIDSIENPQNIETPKKFWRYRIIGKKRPCTTCGVRLDIQKARNIKVDFNPCYGLFYKETLQNEDKRFHKDCLEHIKSNPMHVSKQKSQQENGGQDDYFTTFASESDSD